MTTLYDEVRAALRDSNFRPRKRLGQNFLIDANLIEAIVRLLDLNPHDEVLEIGPGLGFLTRRLVERAAKVWAIEVDPLLVERLKHSEIGMRENFQLIAADILEVRLNDLLPARKIKLVGNLPYSISSPVLFRLLEQREHFSLLVFMVQKEVADRIASRPGTKDYGVLSLWCQAHGRIVAKLPVPPQAFYPRPKVRSTVLKLELYARPPVGVDELPVFRALVRACFAERRKTITNNLVRWLKLDRTEVENLLRTEKIDPRRRGETLSLEEFIGLARDLVRRGLPRPESRG